MKGALEHVSIPDTELARERARVVVLAAFEERERLAHPRHRLRGVALAAAVLALVGGALATPSGRAVLDELREAVGVEGAQPALFRLPTDGRLLVASDAGVWVVQQDGSKRLLGGYREASWSPFGRFVVATGRNELAALESGGDVRWTLGRPRTRTARWVGSETDTRIAYVDRTGIRVVAGDGTGDRLLAAAAPGPLAWRPGTGRVLAYVSAGELRVQDVERGVVLWRASRGPAEPPTGLAWSTDGRRLLVLDPHALRVYDARGALIAQDDPSDGSRNVDAAFQPGTHRLLVARVHGAQSTVFERATGRTVFSGTGTFDGIAVSPDGRWLVIDWRTADQWVFVRTDRSQTITAVSGIASQFRGTPRIEGWCCRD